MMQTNAHYQGCDKSRHTPQLMQLLVESLRADFLALQLADLFVKGSLFLPLDLCEPCSLCKLRGLCRRKLHGCAAVVWRQQTGSYATRRFAIQLGFAWRVVVTIVPLPRAQTEAVSEQTYDACKAPKFVPLSLYVRGESHSFGWGAGRTLTPQTAIRCFNDRLCALGEPRNMPKPEDYGMLPLRPRATLRNDLSSL